MKPSEQELNAQLMEAAGMLDSLREAPEADEPSQEVVKKDVAMVVAEMLTKEKPYKDIPVEILAKALRTVGGPSINTMTPADVADTATGKRGLGPMRKLQMEVSRLQDEADAEPEEEGEMSASDLPLPMRAKLAKMEG